MAGRGRDSKPIEFTSGSRCFQAFRPEGCIDLQAMHAKAFWRCTGFSEHKIKERAKRGWVSWPLRYGGELRVTPLDMMRAFEAVTALAAMAA